MGDRLRILFFVGRYGSVRQYASLIAELDRRGHEVRLVFSWRPKAEARLVAEAALGDTQRVVQDLAPRRGRLDGWTEVAWLVRALGDLARYAHPRYEAAPVLRRRTVAKVFARLAERRGIDPLSRFVAER